MSKRARLLPVAILLLTGVGLCISLLLVVSNPIFPPAPTATPAFVSAAAASTYEPTREIPLPEQCESYQSAYQLQFVEYGEFADELLSPDGEARLYSENRNLYLQPAQGETVTLDDSGTFQGSLAFQAFWSPDSQYAAYVSVSDSLLYVIAADGNNPRSIVRLPHPHAFLAWSPDSRLVAVQEDYLADISLWTVTGERLYSSAEDHETSLIVDQPPAWSPDGRWLSYQWRITPTVNDTGLTPYGFTIVSADGSTSHAITLTESDTPAEPIRQQFKWSPTGQFVAVTYLQFIGDSYQETVRIFDNSGRQMSEMTSLIEGMVYSNILGSNQAWSAIHWGANHQLYYTRVVAHDRFELMLFDSNQQMFKTLYGGLAKPPAYPAVGESGATYIGLGRPYNIEILTPDESRLPFIENASDAGDPDWSPNGEWVAAVWAKNTGREREIFLSWMRPDGTGRRDIGGDYRDLRDLRWLKYSDAVAYVAWHPSESTIEIADTATGAVRTLVSGYDQMYDLTYDPHSDQLSFWWRKDAQRGKDAYQSDGTRLYHIVYPPGLGVEAQEFWSPDRTMVALKFNPSRSSTDDEALLLAYIDDRAPVVLRRNLSGLGDPLWSPDSQLLAFSQSQDKRPVSLEVVDTAGNPVWNYASYPIGRPLAWAECELKTELS